jgi:hypothetical protein
MNLRNRPLTDLAAVVCDALRRAGVEVVLSGGACVSIYTKNAYESYDLDFVLSSHDDRKTAGPVLEALGFRKDGRHYRHPDTPYIVEFLSPPLSVGGEPVGDIRTLRRGRHVLKLLSPTDCIKDRLAAFYHWNDQPSLRQALLVARDAEFDRAEVKRWSHAEGMDEKYAVFGRALRAQERP